MGVGEAVYEELASRIQEVRATLRALASEASNRTDTATPSDELADAETPSDDPRLPGLLTELTEVSERLRKIIADQRDAPSSQSDRRFDALLGALNDAVVVCDPDGRTLAINSAAERLFGRSRDEFLGADCVGLVVPPENQQAARDNIRRVLAGVSTRDEENIVVGADGATRTTLWNADRIVDASGVPVGFVAVGRDVTALREKETALAGAAVDWRVTFDALSDVVWLLDRDFRIVSCNAATKTILGLDREAVVGRRCWEVVHGTSQPIAECPILQMRKSHKRESIELRVGDKWFHVTVDPILAPDGSLRSAVHVISDITERRMALDALRERERVLRNNREQLGLALRASHMGVWDWDVLNNKVEWSPETDRIFGLKPGAFGGTYEAYAEFITPESRDDIGAFVKRFLEEQPNAAELCFEHRINRADGKTAWIEVRGILLRDEQGRAARMTGICTDITQRKKTEEALLRNEAILNDVGVMARVGGWEHDLINRQATWTRALYEIIELEGGTPPGPDEHLNYYPPEEREALADVLQLAEKNGKPFDIEVRCHTAKGRTIWARIIGRPVMRDGKCVKLIGAFQDITDRKQAEDEQRRLEGQLRQSQKMEAIGQLAGGVAHDFNNILTAILGNADLALAQSASENRDVRDALRQIMESAQRAANLTRQLLTFSRRQVSKPEPLDINNVLASLHDMLRRLLTENIVLDIERAPNLPAIIADAPQIEQVVVNLVVNARDAMPNGGRLIVQTAAVCLDSAYAELQPEVRPGDYVMLAVSDTGSGMDNETIERIYEPFFTTKAQGQGTGLGLAMVYGVVKQAAGHIGVYSEPGRGTTFKVYFPAAGRDAAATPAQALDDAAPGGHEAILVCEDDEAVRDLTSRLLKEAGYTLYVARDAQHAIHVAERAAPLHLLLTDVIMPDMNGRELAEHISATRPNLRVLFISGYTASVIAHHGVLDHGIEFLQKPFSRQTLLQRVREVLDRDSDADIIGSV